jgi:hypothetical protein
MAFSKSPLFRDHHRADYADGRLFAGERTFLHPLLRPSKAFATKSSASNESSEQRWTPCAASIPGARLFSVWVTAIDRKWVPIGECRRVPAGVTEHSRLLITFTFAPARQQTLNSKAPRAHHESIRSANLASQVFDLIAKSRARAREPRFRGTSPASRVLRSRN